MAKFTAVIDWPAVAAKRSDNMNIYDELAKSLEHEKKHRKAWLKRWSDGFPLTRAAQEKTAAQGGTIENETIIARNDRSLKLGPGVNVVDSVILSHAGNAPAITCSMSGRNTISGCVFRGG